MHVLAGGRIIKSGGSELAIQLEKDGYGPILEEAGLSAELTDDAALDEPADAVEIAR